MRVFVVQHVHIFDEDYEETKFIGVYSTHEKAQEAIARLVLQPGFSETPEGFCIDEYPIDEDYWTEGYITLTSPQ